MSDDKGQIDKFLITINASILVGYFFVFQITSIHTLVKWTLLISLTLLVISLLLLTWNTVRYPIRKKLFDELSEATIKKYSSRIAAFVKEIIVPYSRLKTRNEMSSKIEKLKTEEEQEALIKIVESEVQGLIEGTVNPIETEGEERATRYVIESFVEQVGHKSQEDYNKAFKSPLKENNAKFKYRLDRVSMRTRRHFFASGAVFAILSMFVQVLSQK